MRMKHRLRGLWSSIRSRVTLLTVSLTLLVTISLTSVSLYQFQSFAQQNLIQSTEFNLHLVAGLIYQDMSALDMLSNWCGVNTLITDYIELGGTPAGLKAFERLEDEYRNNYRSIGLVRRLIVVNRERTRFLQVGDSVTGNIPVTLYNLDRLGPDDRGAWQTLSLDPYAAPKDAAVQVLPVIRPVHGRFTHKVVGFSYMAVCTDIILDPLRDYRVPEGGALYLTIGGDTYRIEEGKFIPCPLRLLERADAETMNAQTAVYAVCNEEGERSVAVSYPVGESGVVLTQSLSRRSFAEQNWLYMRLLLVICAASLLLGLVITVTLNRMINRPIMKLRRRMQAISGGDFSADEGIEWDNEMGDIGRGVNQLSRDIVSLMDTRLADEKKKRDLEYQMLQSQINPHFLYNTLNSIKWMATLQGAAGIAEMITALARLMMAVTKGKRQVISLREEIKTLDDYFVIQQYRYGGAISLTKDISPGTEENAIPRFTLQPLLENAIFHGIEPKGGAGEIRLTARREDGDCLVELTDDGIGMSEQAIRSLFSGGEAGASGMFRQIGVANVHKRIRYEFGEPYGLSAESEPGRYTRVAIRLPFRRPDGEQKEETEHP